MKLWTVLLLAIASVRLCAEPVAPPGSESADSRDRLPSTDSFEGSPYLLGAGDVLSIQFYGRPDFTRPEVTVGPDGTITYLSAVGLRVEGRTISETRRLLEEALSDLYRNPHIIIVPMNLVSKSYTVIGMVKLTGLFPLDQPLTLIEALARAGGTVSGLFDRRYVDLADLERSALIRNGQRVPVNFRRLMLDGDMSQNVPLMPGDTILVASALANDYYVLGSVRKPGREGFTEGATVMAAIAKRLGFENSAYRERVLVVRGSMDTPEVFVVNTDRILKGDEEDFLLQPKDIVYVSNRPWRKVEDLMDSALSVFLQAAVTSWTGASAPIIFSNGVIPILPYGPGLDDK
jgi:polysaccharide biosynthesis/export protein